jgi:membrane protein
MLSEIRCSGLAAWRALVRMLNGDDLTHAAAIAFYALLSIFPFLLLVTSVLGSVTADEADRTNVLRFVFRYFPARLDFVSTQLDAIRQTRTGVGLAGALGLVWGSLGVFGAVTNAVNQAWGVETPRGFWKHRLVSFLMLVAAAVFTFAAVLILSARRVVLASWFGAVMARFTVLEALQTLTLEYLATVLLVFALGLVFYLVPSARVRFRDVWVGAVLTGLLWRGAFASFSWYLSRNAQLQILNGSIALAVAFLLWAYLSSIILMYGVEFTAAHARVRRGRADAVPAAAPSP